MTNRSITRRLGQWLTIAALLGFGLAAMAQSEPTLKQVYEAAQAGRMEQAQTMMQQVLVAHPKSAKAHFVQAELSARQGELTRARESLATAEKLAPGLPFAKPEAVQSLRAKLAGKAGTPTVQGALPAAPAARVASPTAPMPQMTPAAPAAPASSFPWGLGLALGGAAIAGVIFMSRKKPAAAVTAQAPYASQTAYAPAGGPSSGGLSGPQTFGVGGGAAAAQAYGQALYGQSGYGPTGYGQAPAQAAGSGLGGKVVGGLAAGLAVGAGVMAAQAIGRNLMGHDERPAPTPDSLAGNDAVPFAQNDNMGGQDFGINDAGSWDDGGDAVASSDDGGDWDT